MNDGVTVRAEVTPNPEAMKFTVNRMLTDGRPQTYSSVEQAFLSPLARALFAVPGVTGVFLLRDFVTIRRAPGADWGRIAPAVEAAILAHFGAS
jgi:Scaffold protein Nfu/NifU N terminal